MVDPSAMVKKDPCEGHYIQLDDMDRAWDNATREEAGERGYDATLTFGQPRER